MMSMGIDKQINCFSMIPWKLSFQYFDQASNTLKYLDAKVGTPEYNDYWRAFLKDFAAHLKQKGWFEITTIAMDERPMASMQQVIKLVKEADPNYKVALAGNYHKEIETDLYDYCVASGKFFSPEVLAARKAEKSVRFILVVRSLIRILSRFPLLLKRYGCLCMLLPKVLTVICAGLIIAGQRIRFRIRVSIPGRRAIVIWYIPAVGLPSVWNVWSKVFRCLKKSGFCGNNIKISLKNWLLWSRLWPGSIFPYLPNVRQPKW